MPINVVCPGCKKRFAVSDKFAGQKGPCPQCKTVIQVPAKEDEVVVHAPEEAGLKDSKGRSVVAPILREETRFSTGLGVAICAPIVLAFIIALVLRFSGGEVPLVLSALGALAVAPPLVLGGYTFLRNDELEPYRGQELWIRVLACAAVYAVLWGVYAAAPWVLAMEEGFSVYQLTYVAPPFVLVGAFAAFASLDLDYLTGLVHYGLYLIVTVLLRVVAGMPAF